ncbi:MAG: imidazoleglycerol-phosphate dehydratase HisB [Deltaproteobacteria bacterium]|nr:imidazoleglycerol-phosphate dehydratase HisB [Deltaproteobacteria bacterium]
MDRTCEIERKTSETRIFARLNLDGTGMHEISTGIPFFDHMLTLFSVHGFFDLRIEASGDIDVDFHHTVEDVGIVMGDAISKALGDKKGIVRYGHAATPMDETMGMVDIDLSGRPFLIYNLPETIQPATGFNAYLGKEFFRSVANLGGMNLHVNVLYGENDHHIIESVFKSFGRALDRATRIDERVKRILSSKGSL